MKRLFLFSNSLPRRFAAGLLLLGLLCFAHLPAQEGNSLDWDIDSIFDEPPLELPVPEEPQDDTAGGAVIDMIQRRGFYFDISSEFITGVAPAWYHLPWSEDWDNGLYYLGRYIRMRNSFTMDIQISSVFRTRSVIQFEIPNFGLSLGDFFFDYNFYDTVFFRGGKHELSWGISPNYGFTNLLSRVPKDAYDGEAGDSFILKAEVPVGKGGVQALTLTRADLVRSARQLKMEDFGFGAKVNFAYQWADFDIGTFFQQGMALRGFFSIKTTIRTTELYSEWLAAIDVKDVSNISGAFSFGFGQDFFDGKLNVNGELFYNRERDTYWYHPETQIREAGTSPFMEGFNIAVNMLYKPWEMGNPRLFAKLLYAPRQHSAQFIPGFRLSPWSHLEFYMAMPVSLGSKDGYYYQNTVTVDDENRPLPIAFIFLITLKGGIQFGHYF